MEYFLNLDSIPIFVVSIQHSNSFNSMIISEWLKQIALSHLHGYRCNKRTFPLVFKLSLPIVADQDESALVTFPDTLTVALTATIPISPENIHA